MDQEQQRRFAQAYRQMRDEQLAALLAEQGTLTDEAKQALLETIAERPEATGIRHLALEAQQQVERQAQEQAEREIQRKIRKDAEGQLASERPALGFWLGLLIVFLCVLALRRAAFTYAMITMMGVPYPQLVDRDTWLGYVLPSAAVTATVFIAAAIGIHAIYAGRMRSHLWRIVAMLWYVSFGSILVDLTVSALRHGLAAVWPVISAGSNVIYLVLLLAITAAWTGYLTRSERCLRRYPRRSERSVLRVFD